MKTIRILSYITLAIMWIAALLGIFSYGTNAVYMFLLGTLVGVNVVLVWVSGKLEELL